MLAVSTATVTFLPVLCAYAACRAVVWGAATKLVVEETISVATLTARAGCFVTLGFAIAVPGAAAFIAVASLSVSAAVDFTAVISFGSVDSIVADTVTPPAKCPPNRRPPNNRLPPVLTVAVTISSETLFA
jgi:hypothetical protein